MQFERIDLRFNNMEMSLHRSWDTAHVVSNPQIVGQHLPTSNIRSIDTRETMKVARSSPPWSLHNLGSNLQSETISTASEMMETLEDASELGRPLLRVSSWNDSSLTGFTPPATPRNSRHKTTYLEPNAPITHTRVYDQEREFKEPVSGAWLGGRAHAGGARPKRNRITLVQEEEMNNFREDRAGTPHISELLVEDDTFEALSVEELGMEHGFHALLEARHQISLCSARNVKLRGPLDVSHYLS